MQALFIIISTFIYEIISSDYKNLLDLLNFINTNA